MKKRLIRVVAVTSLLALALVLVLGRDNIVYGRGRGLTPAKYRALPAAARAVADATKANLARDLRIAPDRVAVLGVDSVNFPDTSLGVIEPGGRYLDAATPGYVVRTMVAGRPYTYHGSGGRVVAVPAGEESAAVVQRVLRSSLYDLRERLNVGLNEVVVQRIEPIEFPDGSLGAPEPNVPYPLVPTPGYEIKLQARGVAYRYWAAGERLVYVGSFLESGRTVTVYRHKDLSPEARQCGVVHPLTRSVPVTSDASSILALQHLFAGPTEAEAAQGYVSPFSEATAGMWMGIRTQGRTAYLDLADVLPAVLAADDACGREAFLAEVEATLKEVLPVEWVVYSIEGDPLAFCQWMGWCEGGR